MQKEILRNQSDEEAVTRQGQTANPIKVSRVPKAPRVPMRQSSLLRVLIIYVQDFYHLKNAQLKR